jgi:hypothetical protein
MIEWLNLPPSSLESASQAAASAREVTGSASTSSPSSRYLYRLSSTSPATRIRVLLRIRDRWVDLGWDRNRRPKA